MAEEAEGVRGGRWEGVWRCPKGFSGEADARRPL